LARSPLSRLIESLAAAALVAAVGFGASAAVAANGSVATAAVAKGDAGGPQWNELAPAHRQVLAPLANDWNGLDSRSKERWIDVAGRFPKMPPDEQKRATQRMGEWAHMTVQQRTQARTVFQETRGLSKEEREARWKAYQALPEEKKRELAAKRTAAPASGASSNVAFARRHAAQAVDTVQPKNNLIGGTPAARAPAGSAPLLAEPKRPCVTTTLMTRRATPPAHQREGAPKIAVGPNAVDRTTLLPKHTTVAAAPAPASAPASIHR
jgi:hypothetical protein